MEIKKFYRLICLASLLSVAITATSAKVVKMVNPLVDQTNTANLFIDAVELTPDSTIINLHTYNYIGRNIRIQPGVKLMQDGKSYPLRSANGIELGKWIDIPALGDSIFTLSFEPLPIKTKTFDFIEGDGDNDFKLEGIHTDKSFDNKTPIDNLNELGLQKWEKGTAVLNGKIMNYDPSGEQTTVTVYPRSALGRQIDKNIGTTTINPDGSFHLEIPLFQTYQPCFFTAPGFYGLIYISPNEETRVTIDPTQRTNRGHSGKDGSVVFTGANNELNNQLALNIGHDMVWDVFTNNRSRDKQYSSLTEYKSDVLRHTANRKEKIKRLPFTPSMKQLLNIMIDNDMVKSLSDNSDFQNSGFIDSYYYDFLNQFELNDPVWMWSDNFDSSISFLYALDPENLRVKSETLSEFHSYLIENNIAKDQDAEIASVLIANSIDRIPKDVIDEFARVAATRVSHYCDSLNLEGTERISAERLMDRLNRGEIKNFNDVNSYYLTWLINLLSKGHKFTFSEASEIPFENDIVDSSIRFFDENDSIISDFNAKYEDKYNEWKFEKDIDKSIETFTRLYGKDTPIINQLFACYAYMRYIERRNTLSESYLANCRRRLPDNFYEYIVMQNNEMAKVLQRAKSNLLEMKAENSGDEVLRDIAEKYKGKVIYIDIWGTWCSPCLHAISEIQPIKKDYSDNVVFVYLADESSPKKTWEEKIQSIEGEHIRLTQNQMQEIMNRFSFNGYPSYIVIDKDGSISYTGFIHGLDNVKKILDEAIAK